MSERPNPTASLARGRPPPLTVTILVGGEEIDLLIWVRRYVRAILEAEQLSTCFDKEAA